MHYIPKYSRERQNKRQSQNFVTVLDKKKLAKILDENKIIATNLLADTLKKVKLTGSKTKMEKEKLIKLSFDFDKAIVDSLRIPNPNIKRPDGSDPFVELSLKIGFENFKFEDLKESVSTEQNIIICHIQKYL